MVVECSCIARIRLPHTGSETRSSGQLRGAAVLLALILSQRSAIQSSTHCLMIVETTSMTEMPCQKTSSWLYEPHQAGTLRCKREVIKYEGRTWHDDRILPLQKCLDARGLHVDPMHGDGNPEESSRYIGTRRRTTLG